ncbi:nitroreductase family protein [Haliangium ochraceum]|uniref:Nitroreductase n=1 Tax=Haliangium ochraceum (strain DSM 14365 / JCM 11303 / SMP-2) TaxID=502025 RepID=D0LHX5_HALO1|nr:nitroreductase family protein [Haliangium ochraceum]ACY14804.1 nitroreductase [Haliangium ochraceum DSM 14365]
MTNAATTQHAVTDDIAKRYSPRAFSDRELSDEDLRSLLEAARWAASCFNGQPWRFIVATRRQPELFEKIASCLIPFNRDWAEKAQALLFTVAQTQFEHNGKPNAHAWHDVGQAAASMALQAANMGIQIHQMAGIEADKVRESFALPEGYEPVAGVAIGYPGDADSLPEKLRERELAPRERKPLSEIVFGDTWGETSPLIES